MWWKAGDRKEEGCHFNEQEQDRIIQDVGAALASRSLTTTVAASDANNIDNAVVELDDYSAQARWSITQINTHSYAGSERSKLRTLTADSGKRLMMSEWAAPPTPPARTYRARYRPILRTWERWHGQSGSRIGLPLCGSTTKNRTSTSRRCIASTQTTHASSDRTTRLCHRTINRHCGVQPSAEDGGHRRIELDSHRRPGHLQPFGISRCRYRGHAVSRNRQESA